MKLEIEWLHVPEGRTTCDRCQATGQALDRLVDALSDHVQPGFEVALVEHVVPRDRIEESNAVRIDGTPVEDLLGGEVGTSDCEGCCGAGCGDGTAECRTVTVDGETHEALSYDLLKRAVERALASG